MDQAAAIDDGEPLHFSITGGEPFFDFERLVEIVRHAAALGAEISCVTNAYWARSREIARSKLEVLRDAGLTLLAVSVSRFHQRFVPLHRARHALEVSAELGLATELKGAVTHEDLVPEGRRDQWKRELDAEAIHIFPVLAHLREGAFIPDAEYYRLEGLPEQACPGEILTVDYEGIAQSCCSPGPRDDFLRLADTALTPLAGIVHRFRSAARQKILRESGPIAFARAAIAAGLADELRPAYAGPCDLCLHIRTNARLRAVAERLSGELESAIGPDLATPPRAHGINVDRQPSN
jgi:hypothetical protein